LIITTAAAVYRITALCVCMRIFNIWSLPAGMAARGLSPSGGGVYFGQLLGMSDNLTFTLGQHGYEAFKYVPYG
jgi:hypothetical protein